MMDTVKNLASHVTAKIENLKESSHTFHFHNITYVLASTIDLQSYLVSCFMLLVQITCLILSNVRVSSKRPRNKVQTKEQTKCNNTKQSG